MANWSPPSVPRRWLAAAAAFSLLVFVYAVLILGQFLLGVLPTLLLGVLYVLWRFLAAVEAIADAQQRLADQREREWE
jgi:fatty acid desaturase